MAEIKRNFAKGKMNMDFSPFVLPPGEYRELENGQIARSEGSDVGALENIKGNFSLTTYPDSSAFCIGSIRDQQQNKIYYFMAGETEDAIYEYDESILPPQVPYTIVLRSSAKGGFLNFSAEHLITGINLIGENEDRLLYWTDGINPPRRINIQRMITRHRGRLDGVVEYYEDAQGNNVGDVTDTSVQPPDTTIVRVARFTQDEISVIKEAPLNPPALDSTLVRAIDETPRTVDEQLQEENLKEKFVRFAYRWKFLDNEYSAFSPFSEIPFEAGKFQYDFITGEIKSMQNLVRSIEISLNTGPRDVTEVDLLYIDSNTGIVYIVESYNKADEGWGDNQDLRERAASDPEDFTENRLNFSSNKLYRPLPTSELTRVFDDVPTKARAQTIIENRIVYGDYTTRYNIEDIRKIYETDLDGNVVETLNSPVVEDIVVDFDARLATNSISEESAEDTDVDLIGEIGRKSLKSDRDYELAIVYGDNAGRRTPPLTSKNSAVNIPLQRANRYNSMEAVINSKSPEWATWYRWYIKNNKETHYSIVPIAGFIDPSNNQYIWFQLAQADTEKVKEGDLLILKIFNSEFAYPDETSERIEVRIETLGTYERNFLEVNPPRVDPEDLMSDEYEIQAPGTWIKVRNRNEINKDISNAAVVAGDTSARSNNPANAGNSHKPIMQYEVIDGVRTLNNHNGAPYLPSYQDETYYYAGPLAAGSSIDEESITYTGTYDSGSGLVNTANPYNFDVNGIKYGPTDGSEGPMRVEVIIEEDMKCNIAFFLSPAHNDRRVRRRVLTIGGIDIPASGTTIGLINGVSVTFNKEPEEYNIQDKWTCVWRNGENFLWRAYEKSGSDNSNRYRDPNNVTKWAYNARRAKILATGPIESVMSDGINGGSKITLGVRDGINNAQKGTPVSLNGERVYTTPRNVFYATWEEWIFEEGYYGDANDGKTLDGFDYQGQDFGIHQMGFWRGDVVPAGGPDGFGVGILALNAIGLAGNKAEADKTIWRLASDIAYSDEFYQNKPLHMFIESGTYNDKGSGIDVVVDPNDVGINMTSTISFLQGNGTMRDDAVTANPTLAFETIPGESSLDDQIYYEGIGDTFTCSNGIHFGPDKTEHQLITYLTADGTEIQYGDDIVDDPVDLAGVPLTETSIVDSIKVPVDYWNCIAFSNGIESMSIRDSYGTPIITKGVKAAEVIEEYRELRNFAGLIYSGPFVDTTGVNRLNQFSSFDVGSRSILKEMDENYGPIRKLYAENTDVIVFQESKVNTVQVDKNALFNADGSSNVSATNNFLNQTIPVVGEYGISNNPESFAVYGNTKYWADKNRGVILGLQGNTIGELSELGMRDFFRDNLAKYDVILGAYDDYNDKYIVTMRDSFGDPSNTINSQSALISKQGFLSRNDACRFPENRLQYQQVFEFYSSDVDENGDPIFIPQKFIVGDTIFVDKERTSVFSGDDDWFVTFEPRSENVTSVGTIPLAPDATARFDFTSKTLENPIIVGQIVTLTSVDSGIGYTAEVTLSEEDSITVVFEGETGFPDGDQNEENWVVSIDFKYVIRIDNYGVVRRKLDCLGVTPYNHDAFRTSLRGFGSAEEACANGLVGKIFYHNGNDATPDEGDYIYNTPYGGDEYVEVYQNWTDDFPYQEFNKVVFNGTVWQASQDVPRGQVPGDEEGGTQIYWTATEDPINYIKGRSTVKGWLKIFDGDLYEEWVIYILQGTVQTKKRCAAVDAGRVRVSIGSHFIQREGEGESTFANRVCSNLPHITAFHNGSALVPEVGNTLFRDDYTDELYAAGAYSVSGGYYIKVNESGMIFQVTQCVERVCYSDLTNTFGTEIGLFETDITDSADNVTQIVGQINQTGTFTFLGIIDEAIYGVTDRQNASNVTIRWAARGSQRFPSSSTDYYERTFEDLDVGTEIEFPAADFETKTGESRLEYTIVEFCYDRPLIPSFIQTRYYNDGGDFILAENQTWTDATTTVDATLTLTSDAEAIKTWNFLNDPVVPITTVPTSALAGVAAEDFSLFYDLNPLALNNGSTLSMLNRTITFVGTGVLGTMFDFTNDPGPNDNIRISYGGIPDCVDPNTGKIYTYPSGDGEDSIARIFNNAGSVCVGLVSVTSPIFYNATAITSTRRYFLDDTLRNGLPGTTVDGEILPDSSGKLEKVVIDGVDRFGLWWAFGDVDSGAATEALLIDKDGYELDNRQVDYPFKLNLGYHASSEIAACSDGVATEPFLVDSPKFNTATSFVGEDGTSIPATGWYVWTDPDDPDSEYVRYWNRGAFDPDIPLNTCPAIIEPTLVFYSEDQQDVACNTGVLRTIFIEGDMPLDEGPAALFTNEYGRRSAVGSKLPSGYVQSQDRLTRFAWDSVAETLTDDLTTACTRTCTTEFALNIDEPGICRFPRYCNDNRYGEYLEATLKNGTKVQYNTTTDPIPPEFTPDATHCVVLLPDFEPRTVSLSIDDTVTTGDKTSLGVLGTHFNRTLIDDITLTVERDATNNYNYADGTPFPEVTGIYQDSFGYLPNPTALTGVGVGTALGFRSDPGDPLTITATSDPASFTFDNTADTNAEITITNSGNTLSNQPVDVTLNITNNITAPADSHTLSVSGGGKIGDVTTDRVLPGNNWDLDIGVSFTNTNNASTAFGFSVAPTVTFQTSTGSNDNKVETAWNGSVIALQGFVDDLQTEDVVIYVTISGTIVLNDITPAPTPSVYISGVTSAVTGDSVSLTANASNFTSNVAYLWTGGDAEDLTTATVTGLSGPGDTSSVRYGVTVTSLTEVATDIHDISWSDGCTATGPTATISGPSTNPIAGANASLSVVGTGGNAANCTNYSVSSYTWDTSTATVISGCGSLDTTCVVNSSSAGDITIGVLATNNQGTKSSEVETTVTWTAPPVTTCTNTSAVNTGDAGLCYYAFENVRVSTSSDGACDSYNAGGVTLATYTLANSPTLANGLFIFQQLFGVYVALANGWYTNDGNGSFQISNGVVSDYSATACPAYPRISTVSISLNSNRILTTEGLSGSVGWTGVGLPTSGLKINVTATSIGSTDITTTTLTGNPTTWSIPRSAFIPGQTGQFSCTATVTVDSNFKRDSATFTVT